MLDINFSLSLLPLPLSPPSLSLLLPSPPSLSPLSSLLSPPSPLSLSPSQAIKAKNITEGIIGKDVSTGPTITQYEPYNFPEGTVELIMCGQLVLY